MQVLAMMALLSVGLVNLAASQTYTVSCGLQKKISVELDPDAITFDGFFKAVHEAVFASLNAAVQFSVDGTILNSSNLDILLSSTSAFSMNLVPVGTLVEATTA